VFVRHPARDPFRFAAHQAVPHASQLHRVFRSRDPNETRRIRSVDRHGVPLLRRAILAMCLRRAVPPHLAIRLSRVTGSPRNYNDHVRGSRPPRGCRRPGWRPPPRPWRHLRCSRGGRPDPVRRATHRARPGRRRDRRLQPRHPAVHDRQRAREAGSRGVPRWPGDRTPRGV